MQRTTWAAGLVLGLSLLLAGPAVGQSGPAPDLYQTRIAPIFEKRCVACHSCYNAPCQFNVQSYAGAARGATTTNVYDATRLQSVPPTRLGIDASSTAEWRKKGFFDVLGAGTSDQSLLMRLVRLRQQHAGVQPSKQAAQSQTCPTKFDDPRLNDPDVANAIGMPYGLPPLPADDIAALDAWVAAGAPGPHGAGEAAPREPAKEIAAWEDFFNKPGEREKLVSRYLYEHLFLAHLHFDKSDARGNGKRPQFFRLVRSRTACGDGIEEIATRRPTDVPDTPSFFYCLKPFDGVIVEKTHIPYELSGKKLDRIRSLFFGEPWEMGAVTQAGDASLLTPFQRYAPIPVRARYQFLLDDAQYHIATFIKGPVCNGASAVNSIQEQFFVFFLKPDADSMVMLPKFASSVDRFLRLPGAYGSNIGLLSDFERYTQIVEYRDRYRELRAESVKELRPRGYSLDDIWDGDGSNSNALLTVFRHFDNAAVVKGAVGDLSKTVFVLDYSLVERLVYNLVVDFDVFGNVGHQFLTRSYMDLIRMEAEELFLSFLPPDDRTKIRNSWYVGGLLTDIKMRIVFPLANAGQPTDVKFRTKDVKREFVERALFERLSPSVRGAPDPINWRRIGDPGSLRRSRVESDLREMAAIPAVDATPFSRFFPELSYLLVKRPDGARDLYSIAHNRELENVSWIMGEDLRLAPKQDTLTIARGVLGAYPDMIFEVDEREVAAFSRRAVAIKNRQGYSDLVDRFGVERTSPRFWSAYDEVNRLAYGRDPVRRGIVDLTRYTVDAK